MSEVTSVFAIVALVLTVSALASGLVDRAPISYPMIFLGMGVLLGPAGLGFVQVGLHDPTLEAVATLNLALVLFLDAMRLRVDAGPRGWLVPALVLGPGTVLTIVLVTVSALLLLRLSPLHALMLGTVLASTDPVVLRDVLRDTRIPSAVRQVLQVEAGTNDVVVLPVLLILIAVAVARAGTPADWAAFLARILILGPVTGALIGGSGAWLMGTIDAKLSVRREYQALYGLGLVLAAYCAGVGLGGDGFLAAFAAGFTVGVLNYEMCDCFMEYGDVTAEMAMLLAFILFGALLSTMLGAFVSVTTVLFALVSVLVARPVAMAIVLRIVPASAEAKAFISWFGPRGLNSLLLVLLAIRENVPGGEPLLGYAGMVVILSVLLHGVSATPLSALYAREVARKSLPEEREGSPAALLRRAPAEVDRITAEDLKRALSGPNPPLVLDVRTRSDYERDPSRIPGSVRVFPDHVVTWAATAPRGREIVTYCG